MRMSPSILGIIRLDTHNCISRLRVSASQHRQSENLRDLSGHYSLLVARLGSPIITQDIRGGLLAKDSFNR